MALKGTLQEFPISDIFQLVGQQKKSGSLYVRSGDKQARIIFDDGRVIVATFLESDDDFLLGAMLVNAGVLRKEQLVSAVLAQKSNGKTIGDTLIQMKLINPQILSEFIRLQVDEVLFRIFRWETGLYEFIPEKIRFNRGIIEAQNAEALLMDSFRKKDEWPRIEQTLGDFDAAFAPAAAAAALDDAEKRFLALFGAGKPLIEVIRRSRLGTFEAARVAHDLVRKGALVRIVPSAAEPQSGAGRFAAGEWLLTNALPCLALLAVSIALPCLWIGPVPPASGPSLPTYSVEGLARVNRLRPLENARRMYVVKFGAAPPSVEILWPDARADDWIYLKTPEGYTLAVREND